MGNYISCAFVPPLMKNNSKVARVIFPSGEVKQFRDIVKAAELMLDNPNYFLTNSRSLHINRRFSPLSADEELEFGNLYVFFPMRRLNSLITAADVAALFVAATSVSKRISSGNARVQPENGGGASDQQEESSSGVPMLSLEGVNSSGFQAYRLSYCRSRKPVLETISEEPVVTGKRRFH